ncbi:uncharacterized protein LOC119906758 isoform X1 [Micropterus salmoides]|uniref:uncharacterized protein LOC119906758 isoform X1 n=1 Tax=Micropterus salmoides TaxID=27706 RepID=UPI0018EC1E34|nr:uncharacterized protein LOC119906758 isoform X1 [Micropterus salmoides]
METERQKQRKEEFLKQQEFFRTNAVLIINEMVKMRKEEIEGTEAPSPASPLVDEFLHSIFFLGKINNPEFSPECILDDDDILLKELKDKYPQPFVLCSSQVPKRSPMSYVLNMIVNLMGQENEDTIIKRLRELTIKLKPGETKHLVSSTVCVSQKNSDRYYGVSMSTSGPIPGRIMIAASCLSTWDSNVAGAVMTYYPENKEKTKKTYFDGTIKLPEEVRCQAFSLSDRKEMPPCRSCGNLFGLTTSENREWPYGHCAEAESLSNLFKKKDEEREQPQPESDENRKMATESVLKELIKLLNMQKFKWDRHFYTLQV